MNSGVTSRNENDSSSTIILLKLRNGDSFDIDGNHGFTGVRHGAGNNSPLELYIAYKS